MQEAEQLKPIISFRQYQQRAQSTAFYPHVMEGCHPEAITYVTFGLNGEAGEFAEKLKKTWRDNGGFHQLSNERRIELLDELGDLLWYCAQAASELGCSLEQVASWNLEKLAARARYGKEGWNDDRKYQVLKLTDRYVGTDRLDVDLRGEPEDESLLDQWKRLMSTYPRDGWDGAARAIAEHDREVISIELALDEKSPGWHHQFPEDMRRRSVAP